MSNNVANAASGLVRGAGSMVAMALYEAKFKSDIEREGLAVRLWESCTIWPAGNSLLTVKGFVGLTDSHFVIRAGFALMGVKGENRIDWRIPLEQLDIHIGHGRALFGLMPYSVLVLKFREKKWYVAAPKVQDELSSRLPSVRREEI